MMNQVYLIGKINKIEDRKIEVLLDNKYTINCTAHPVLSLEKCVVGGNIVARGRFENYGDELVVMLDNLGCPTDDEIKEINNTRSTEYIVLGRIIALNNKKNKLVLTIGISRPFKNAEGIYETDYINLTLNGSIMHNTLEYCKKGDFVGARGNIKGKELIVEKITFLSSKKNDE